MYTVKLPVGFTGERYGMVFSGGVGQTNNARIADTLKGKGFEVSDTSIYPNAEPEQGGTLALAVSEESTDYNDMDDEVLAALAAERQVDVDGKTRRQVINALKKAEV